MGAAIAAGEPACRVFEFLLDDIQALKAQANTGGEDAVSSFQALAAHSWKHVTKARGPQDASQDEAGVAGEWTQPVCPAASSEVLRECGLQRVHESESGRPDRAAAGSDCRPDPERHAPVHG